MANGQQFYVYACNRNVPAWSDNIATTNYISYKVPSGSLGAGSIKEVIDCTPKSATQSVWYGKTVLTNYEYCQKNFGSFSPLTVNYSTASGTHIHAGGSGACNSFGECKYSSQIDVGYCTVK